MLDADSYTGNALQDALTIQLDAAACGFDWPGISGVIAKVLEEIAEFEAAHSSGDKSHAEHEIGDVLFSVVNLARFVKADPARELAQANARFKARFAKMKERFQTAGRSLGSCSLDEMDAVWKQVKRE